MMNEIICQAKGTVIQEPDLEDQLLARRLVSQIVKTGDGINLTITGSGMAALINAITSEFRTNEEGRNQSLSNGVDSHSGFLQDFITKKEAMEQLHVSQATLWNWERRKYLVPVKIGRKVFYSIKDIRNLSKTIDESGKVQ